MVIINYLLSRSWLRWILTMQLTTIARASITEIRHSQAGIIHHLSLIMTTWQDSVHLYSNWLEPGCGCLYSEASTDILYSRGFYYNLTLMKTVTSFAFLVYPYTCCNYAAGFTWKYKPGKGGMKIQAKAELASNTIWYQRQE